MAPLIRARERSTWRSALAFALVAAGGALVVAWLSAAVARAALERAARGAVEHQLVWFDGELRRAGSDVAAALERLQEVLLADPARRAGLARGGPPAVGEAAALAEGSDLDLLTILEEPAGSVVTSREWPQLAGLRAPWLDALAETEPAVRRVDGPRGASLAVLVRLRLDEGPLSLVGGQLLGPRFADRLGAAPAVWVVDLDPSGGADKALLAGPDLPASWAGWARTGGPRDPPRGPRGEAWIGARRILLDDRGRAQAVAVAAIAVGDPFPAGAATGVAGAIMLAAAGGAVAGAWTSRRLARPVDRLVRAVEAIAAGRADYTFAAPGGQDVDRIAEAFSRLERALGQQRLRSAAAERVAAWREVARHVAHEVKNPLAPIRLTVENLVRARGLGRAEFDALFDEGARTILEEVDQLNRLVGEFSEFARLPAPRPRAVEPHVLLDGVLDLHAAEPGLEVVREYGATAMIEADPDQLGRVLKNLVGNAVEAMREGGRPPRLVVRTYAAEGRFEVEIDDSGPGIPAAAAGRLFEPYITTKPQGTGLGMAIARRIVVEHGGELAVENRPEGGARVRLSLPLGLREEAVT